MSRTAPLALVSFLSREELDQQIKEGLPVDLTPADNRLQSTPLPNAKWLLTCDFMSSIVAPMTPERIYRGTSEIMKTIIARDLTGLRA